MENSYHWWATLKFKLIAYVYMDRTLIKLNTISPQISLVPDKPMEPRNKKIHPYNFEQVLFILMYLLCEHLIVSNISFMCFVHYVLSHILKANTFNHRKEFELHNFTTL